MQKIIIPFLVAIAGIYFYKSHKMLNSSEDKYEIFVGHLATVHRVLRRGIESMLKNAEAGEKDVHNFMGYSISMLENLHFHHGHEDNIFFPFLRDQFPVIDKLDKDHKELGPLIHELDEYCKHCQAGKEKYDSKRFTALVSKLKDFVYPHLAMEETEMSVLALKEKYPDPEVLMTLSRKIAKVAPNEGSKFTTLSFLVTQLTTEEKMSMFNKVPFFVRDLLFPAFTWVNSGYWKYSSNVGGEFENQ